MEGDGRVMVFADNARPVRRSCDLIYVNSIFSSGSVWDKNKDLVNSGKVDKVDKALFLKDLKSFCKVTIS